MAGGFKGIYFQSFAVKMENAVIIFLKYPEPGKVKTRLAKDIGNEKSCEIYKLLAEGIIKNVAQNNLKTYDGHIFFTPADKENEIKNWLKSIIDNEWAFHIQYSPQKGNTLGERMSNAFQQTLQRKDCKRCIIIGTDCPEIDATLIESVFEILKEKDIVIGPCKDGGYYLLGMSGFVPDLFVDIDWSTDQVFIQTMEKVQKNNLSCSILKILTDIDTQEDLYRYKSITNPSFHQSRT